MENLISIQELGKATGIGSQKIFSVLADKVIYKTKSDNYFPSHMYDRLFSFVIENYFKNGKRSVYSRLMLTPEGYSYFLRRYIRTNVVVWGD